MAWINYINLEAARFLKRAKEMGVRRIIGSSKNDLMLQCMVEFLCLTIIAIFAAAFLLYFIIPYFAMLTGISASHTEWLTPRVVLAALAIFIMGTLFVGVYPALFLLKLNPVTTLKGHFGNRGSGKFVGKSLIVLQFTASLVLVAMVLLVSRQLDFMRVTNKKIALDQVIALRNPTAYSNQQLQLKHQDYKLFENRLLENSAVKMVASSSAIPGTEIGFSYINLLKRDLGEPYDPTVYKTLFVDYNFIPVYELKILAGRNFDRPVNDAPVIEPWLDATWTTIVLNETAVRKLGFRSPEEAIGETVNFQLFDDFQKYRIIGVVEDYHHQAIKSAVYPTIFAMNFGAFQQVYYSIRLQEGTHPQDAIGMIQRTWKRVFPEKPFEYFFLDEYYDQQFKSEVRFTAIFTFFAVVAICIASLGIIGMTIFQANARMKEISIRKVLGASLANIISLLSRSHLIIVLLSATISAPLIFFIGSLWLATYPVRIEISPLFFVIPLLIILAAVVVTSFFQTWKAATTNPIDHIKHE
jgi:putative ABC transport system permease protein